MNLASTFGQAEGPLCQTALLPCCDLCVIVYSEPKKRSENMKQLVNLTAVLCVSVQRWSDGWRMCELTSALCAHHVSHCRRGVFMLTGDGVLHTQYSPSYICSWFSGLIHISLITHSVAPSSFLLLPPSTPFATTTGKTTTTSTSTTYHGAAFPKEAGDPERGTGADDPPSVGEQGSPDSEPISVEMEGKGEGCLSLVNFDLRGVALLGLTVQF